MNLGAAHAAAPGSVVGAGSAPTNALAAANAAPTRPLRPAGAAFAPVIALCLAIAASVSLGGCRASGSSAPASEPAAGVGTVDGEEAQSPPEVPVDPAEMAGVAFDDDPYDVTHVVDGDTIHVRRDGRDDKVRLLGINAPETGDGRRAVQCFGQEAKARLREHLAGRRVYLATDPTADTRDRYGRLLAYVWRDDGLFANLAMLSDGFANEYTFDRPYHHRALFRAAARAAREANRGLWAPDTCDGDFDAAP